MDLSYSPEDEAFRAEVRAWLEEALSGEFAELRGLGGPGREHEAHDERLAWDRHLAQHGWTCIGWPTEYGGRGLPLFQQVIFHEEYARADAPARVNHLGEELLGPTLIAFGTDEQKQRFLPKIVAVEELWCQGYSEPGAGSDLANVSTKARLRRRRSWVIDGQKVWTSLAHQADWCFVVARTEPGSQAAPRPVLPARPDGPGGRRDPADHPAHRHLGVQRGLLQRGPHRRRPRRRRRRQRLEGRDGHARLRARHLHDRPAGRLPARARRAARGGPRQRDVRRPGDPRPPRAGAGRARGDPPERAPHPERGPGAPAGQHLQAALGRLAPHPRRARDAGARRRLADHRARLRPRRVAADVPVHPRGHHLRRVRRDPAQRPGRASPRPAREQRPRESR